MSRNNLQQGVKIIAWFLLTRNILQIFLMVRFFFAILVTYKRNYPMLGLVLIRCKDSLFDRLLS